MDILFQASFLELVHGLAEVGQGEALLDQWKTGLWEERVDEVSCKHPRRDPRQLPQQGQ